MARWSCRRWHGGRWPADGGRACRATGDGGGARRPAAAADDQAALDRWVAELEAYFRGRAASLDRRRRSPWTIWQWAAFARAVYATLLTVPAGETVSYGELAEMAGLSPGGPGGGQRHGQQPDPDRRALPPGDPLRRQLGNYGNDPAWKERSAGPRT